MIDKRLLQDTGDEHVKVDMLPSDVLKLVRRLRRVSLFLRVDTQLITARTEDNIRYVPSGRNLRVTQSQMLSHVTDVADTAERLL